MTDHDYATKMAVRRFVNGLVDATRLTQPEYERVVEKVLKALPPYAMCREVIAAERTRLGIKALVGASDD